MLARETGLSLRILRHLAAGGGGWTPISHLVEETGLSRAYVGKLCHRLRTAGYLQARQGVRGGFRLHPRRRDATYYDLVVDLDDPFRTATCLTLRAPCDEDEPCGMHESWERLRAELVAALKTCPIVTEPGSREPEG